MDFSIIAAVGSFVVSERVLKPKATALFFLGCILAYDLTTKTHDISGLRVYRGPAMIAFTLMMAAASLRTWRRNGVACDELLFLPGTLHGHQHGVEGPLIEMPSVPGASTSPRDQYEADMAAGGFNSNNNNNSISGARNNNIRRRAQSVDSEDEEGSPPASSVSLGNTSSSFGDDITNEEGETVNERDEDINEEESNRLMMHRSESSDDIPSREESSGILARIKQLWSFFFFRATAGIGSSNATYAPSGPEVFGAALDLSMPVLFNFHLFIEAYNHIQGPAGEIPAKILPIIFLSVLIVRTTVPPGRRFRFWNTLKFTFTAPLHRVRFRDDFIGESLTSWIRPGQDLFFALSYYGTVIWGTLSGKYGLAQCGALLEDSWLLHNVLLPSFAILPLWLKYLQTLRQAYDNNKRWPHLGNAFKYLTATVVIIYGVTHPEKRSHPIWVTSFAVTLIYQIFWDTIMDWDLFEIQRDIQAVGESDQASFCYRISSFQPSSRWLLNVQMYVVQPVLNAYQRIPSWKHIRLRQKRLYKTEKFYWKIFVCNTLMRFTWMTCLIPSYHVSRRKETVLTSTSDINTYWGVLLPVAEIIRRTLWGFLFVERETIKLMDADSIYSQISAEEDSDDEDDTSKYSSRTQLLPTWLDNQQQLAHNAATSRSKQRAKLMHQLFLLELHVWAAAFVVFGCLAAS
jgi:hypothetical protein